LNVNGYDPAFLRECHGNGARAGEKIADGPSLGVDRVYYVADRVYES
jgi:hypothetical protein